MLVNNQSRSQSEESESVVGGLTTSTSTIAPSVKEDHETHDSSITHTNSHLRAAAIQNHRRRSILKDGRYL